MSAHIHLANPRGFCAGVDRAIGIVERALDLFGAPIFCSVRRSTCATKWYTTDSWSITCASGEQYSSRNWTKCRTTRR